MVSCSALDPDDLKQYEQNLIGSLKSPASYKRVGTFAWSDEASVEKLQSTYFGPELFSQEAQMLEDIKGKKIELRPISIECDADNRFGAAIRDTKYCNFIIADNQLYKPSPAYEKKWDEYITGLGDDKTTDTIKNKHYTEPVASGDEDADPFASVTDCCIP